MIAGSALTLCTLCTLCPVTAFRKAVLHLNLKKLLCTLAIDEVVDF